MKTASGMPPARMSDKLAGSGTAVAVIVVEPVKLSVALGFFSKLNDIKFEIPNGVTKPGIAVTLLGE